MNDSLYQLYMAREVSQEECMRVSPDPNEFLRSIGERPDGEQDGTGDKNARPAMAGRR